MSEMGFLSRKYHEYRERLHNRSASGSMYRPGKGIFSRGGGSSSEEDYEEPEPGKGAGAVDGISESDILLKSETFTEESTEPYRIILWKKGDREYVTHTQVLPRDGTKPYQVWGHYYVDRTAAEKDYQERVKKAKARPRNEPRGGSGNTVTREMIEDAEDAWNKTTTKYWRRQALEEAGYGKHDQELFQDEEFGNLPRGAQNKLAIPFAKKARGGAGYSGLDPERMQSTPAIEDIIKESIMDEDHARVMYSILASKLWDANMRDASERVASITKEEDRHYSVFQSWWKQKYSEPLDVPRLDVKVFYNQTIDDLITEAVKGEMEDRQKYLGLSVKLHEIGNHSLAKDAEMIARDESLHYEYFFDLAKKRGNIAPNWASKYKANLEGKGAGEGPGMINVEQIFILELNKFTPDVQEEVREACGPGRPSLDPSTQILIVSGEDDLDNAVEVLELRGIRHVILETEGSQMERASDLFAELIDMGFDEQGAIHHVEIAYGKSVADALWAEMKAEEKDIRGGGGGFTAKIDLVRKPGEDILLAKYITVEERDGIWYHGTTPHKKSDLLKYYDIKERYSSGNPAGGGAGTASSFR